MRGGRSSLRSEIKLHVCHCCSWRVVEWPSVETRIRTSHRKCHFQLISLLIVQNVVVQARLLSIKETRLLSFAWAWSCRIAGWLQRYLVVRVSLRRRVMKSTPRRILIHEFSRQPPIWSEKHTGNHSQKIPDGLDWDRRLLSNPVKRM